MVWYEKALVLSTKYNYIETKSIVNYYIGEVYRKSGDIIQAKKYFTLALAIDTNMKRKSGIGWNKHSLAEIALSEGNFELANKLHKEAHEAFSKVGVIPIDLECNKLKIPSST